ncbi:MAG: V-type ATP synthase subunit F [Acutalibacteraceae bacterium]
MKKQAVIGNSDSVKGFRAVGLQTFEIDEPELAAKTIKKLAENDFAVCYITERLFTLCADEIAKFDDKKEFAVIPIPGTYGNTGIGIQNVSRSVEKAVGSDIISED